MFNPHRVLFIGLLSLTLLAHGCSKVISEDENMRLRFAAEAERYWLWQVPTGTGRLENWPKVTFSVKGRNSDVLEAYISSGFPPMMQPSPEGVLRANELEKKARQVGFKKVIIHGADGADGIEIEL